MALHLKISHLNMILHQFIVYTKEQLETINRLQKILKMIDEGKTNSEIFDSVYGIKHKKKRTSKMCTLRLIRRRKIFKDEINKYYSDMFND